MRTYDDPVHVRRGASEDPDEFLWRGRAWQVREVLSHWVETGAWWLSSTGSAAGEADFLDEREMWRVTAERGFRTGVFDLVFSWTDGAWRLTRAYD